MAKKEVVEFLQKAGIVAGLGVGVAGGILSIDAMNNYSDTTETIENKQTMCMQSATRENLIKESEKALYDAYKKGIISRKEYTSKLDVLHSVDYAYNNRDKILSEADAKAWEDAKKAYNGNAMKLLGSTSLTGLSFGVAGIIALNKGYKDLDEAKKRKKAQNEFDGDEHYHGA